MTKEEIISKLTEIFHDVFNDDTIVIRDDMTAADVDTWDSMTNMVMITSVEEQFGIKFKLRELGKLKVAGDLISVIESKLSEA